ncbi:MAG: bZIP transcription factor [Verrucomicrobiales bacterium]|nr:bZIP transcription factor [Verrucomicrobiales bacterium]
MHPAALLGILSTAASIAGGLCWGKYQRHLREGRPETLPAHATAADGSSMAPLTDLAFPGGSGAEGVTATLQRQTQTLEDQNRQLREENTDLRRQLAELKLANTPPPTPSDLAVQFSEMRQIPFRSEPKLAALPLEAIQDKAKQAVLAQVSPESGGVRSRAFQAMGFVPDPFDFRTATAELAASQTAVFYDPAVREAFYQDDADLRRKDSRTLVVAAAQQALLAQVFPQAFPLPFNTAQDDEARALRSLVLGENLYYKIRWSVQDNMPDLVDTVASPLQPVPAYAPLFFSEEYKFTFSAGQNFVEAVLQKGGESALTAVYQRPPRSTTELLHPELYFATPPFTPVTVDFGDAVVEGHAPYFTNTAGEMGVHYMMRIFMSQDLSLRIADGWAGDRYAVYDGDPQHGDHTFWKTVWRTAGDGTDFFAGMRRLLMQRHTIPLQKEHDQPRAFIVNDPHRNIRIRQSEDGRTVIVINATTAQFADALGAKFGIP